MNWKSFIIALVAIAVVVLVLVFAPNSDQDDTDRTGVDADTNGERVAGVERTPADGYVGDPTRRDGRPPLPTARSTTQETGESATGETVPSAAGLADDGSNSERFEEGRASDTEARDAGADEDMRPWQDPVNRRVLGDKRWIAPIDPKEEERIDEVFEKARAARHDPRLSRQDRLTSIDVAERVVDACFEELDRRKPGIEGRLIVRWTSGANNGEGWIRDPEITVNYRLEDAMFEACILDALPRQEFPADDGEAVVVEYPFFYDGAF